MKIELKHIHKRFGAIHANNAINLQFNSGRIIGILGENGAGKSTLMKILSGFQPADSGEILLDDQRADYQGPLAAIRHGIGMLQQDPLDVGAFTVLENFIYGGHEFRRDRAQQTLANLCQRFGFDLPPDTPTAHLTIGQRQQLEIVRLLALGVRALILDEPTTGISAEQKEILFNALRELANRDSVLVLLVSHKLEDVLALCDEVAVLRAGQVVGTLEMPATIDQLVTLMFGDTLKPQTRPPAPPQPEGKLALQLDRIHVHDKRLHVRDFSLEVKPGEVVGFAGLDHSGQELVLRACAGLTRIHHGKISINQQVMTGKSYRSFLGAGVAFAAAGRLEEGLIAGLTLTEHIALATQTKPLVDWAQAQQTTAAQLHLYDVRGTPDSLIETLSGGNQQRVLMALMPQQPAVLILENPARGLDVDSARWIWQQLLLRRDGGTAILFSSPDLDELVNYSDRIIVFYAGKTYHINDVSQTNIDQLGRLIGGHFDEE